MKPWAFRLSVLLLLIVAGAPAIRAQTTAWRIDPLHSSAQFSVRHMMISTVRGQFGGVKGEVVNDAAHPEKSSVDATIDCTTVNTGETKRDADLKTAQFFDVKQYPTMKFKSTGVEVAGAGKLKVNGMLTINAVSRPASNITRRRAKGFPDGIECCWSRPLSVVPSMSSTLVLTDRRRQAT